ncbi:Uncharacterised protein [Pseudomonas putida]|nr:Uncharacterised protein [Pseudomonas putida]CAB5542271.1 Uncharacterised protein [Pseudomonas putida]CAB5543635.1 Uncharacterised protein [Pseudomonas putida]CAB5637956.1 Uncharacterised protein [Pseudomonas putida]CAB5654038.1 Uncharacterised protein [Pseudomonas putida]
MKVENQTLVIDDQRIALPAIEADAVVNVWAVPLEYRDSGYFVAVKLPGQPEEIPACSPADAVWVGEVPYPAPEVHKVAAAKAARLKAINAQCEAELAVITATYPTAELQSWSQQVQEAAVLKLDPPGDTPLLDAIAQARGIDVVDLAQRVRDKAKLFAQASGALIGRRQAAEDRLDAAQTLEAVEVVQW